MKAFLLAAGVGSRLRPLTDRLPKCLIPVDGEPLLGIWLRKLRACGVTSVLVNTHHLAAQVEDFLAGWRGAGLEIQTLHEPELLGSAGTVAANRDFVRGEDWFFVLYADNLTNIDLTAFYRFHRSRPSPFTIGLFETPEPEQCGIAALAPDGRIVEFVEKPRQPRSNLANSGLYIAGPDLLEIMPRKRFNDFGFDILPLMVGRMYGYRIPEFFCDLGTLDRVERARREWPGLKLEREKIC